MSRKLELYVYTTKTYKKQNLLKIGHCIKGRHKERIREQFNASNPEQPIILWVKDLPEGKTDKHIHQQLTDNGIDHKADGSGKEWFYADLEDVEKAYNQIKYGIKREKAFSLRKEQKEAVNEAVKWFQNPRGKYKNRFLLNAKMRFGKSFTALNIVKKLKGKRTIIVTFHPKVKPSWFQTVLKDKNFKDWQGVTSQNIEEFFNCSDYHCLNNDIQAIKKYNKNLVFFISRQDLDYTKAKLKDAGVFDTNWDFLIYDEVHYGENTTQTESILSKLSYKKRIDISGTPFKFMDRYNLHKDQIFTYTYLDEYENKRQEEQNGPENNGRFEYREFPTMNLMTLNLEQHDIEHQRNIILTANKDCLLNERFSVKNNKFKYDQSVNDFLDKLTASGHDKTEMSVYGDLGKKCNFSTKKRHSVWWVNTVETARLLEKKLNQHFFFKNYEIINVSGSHNNLEENKLNENIEKANSDPSKEGSVTLTVKRFLTGSTVEMWDTFLVLRDSKSPEEYFQAIFRVQSPWVEDNYEKKPIKKNVYVFDFSVKRVLENIYKLAEQPQGQKWSEKKKIISQLLKSMHIKSAQFIDGELQISNHTLEDILQYYYYKPLSLAKRLNSRRNLISTNWQNILKNSPGLEEIIEKIRGYRNINTDTEDPNPTLISGGSISESPQTSSNDSKSKNGKNRIKSSKKNKDIEKKIKRIRDQAVRLSIVLVDFMYMTRKREESLEHILKHRQKERLFFKDTTGITVEEFNKLCKSGLLVKEELDGRIYNFFTEEDSSVFTEKYIFEHITKKSA